jgi:CheY-like chemotaxis protein
MPAKLLLADDSVTIQRVIELTFAGEDVQVLTAGDGEQAIHRIQADRPDIVLADIGMPKRSGYDVAAFVKGHPELSHIPVLLLTGAFEPVDEGRAQAVGCDGVLVKPFEPQNVIARVRELLQGAGGRSTARAVADVPRPVERLSSHRVLELPPRYDSPPAPRPLDNPSGALGLGQAAGARAANDSALDDYFDRLDAAFANIATHGSEPPAARASEQAVHEPQVLPRSAGPVMESELDWFDSPSRASAEPVAPSQPALPPASDQHAVDTPAREPEQPSRLTARHVSPEPATPPTLDPSPAGLPATFASPPTTINWPVPGVVEGLTGGIRHPEPPPPEPPDQSPTLTSEPTSLVEHAAEPAPAPAPAPPAASAPPPAATPAPGARETAPPVHAASLADAFSALLAVEQGEPGAAPVRLMTARVVPEVTDELIDTITRRVVERLAPGAVRDVVAQVVSEVAERLVRDEISRIRSR